MSEKWNEDQRKAIENTEGNMIVSASAGSGKTSVMIERVKRLVIDKKTPVSRIVMLSFNAAIAEEIKEKLTKALIEAVREAGDDERDFLYEQIDSVSSADITTVHGFSNGLIKEYFDAVGVDPTYSVIDDKEGELIIGKALRELFDDCYREKDSEFLLLKDKLSPLGDEALKKIIKNIFVFQNALLDGDGFLDRALSENYLRPLKKAKAVRIVRDGLQRELTDAFDAVEEAYSYFRYNSPDSRYYPCVEAMYNNISRIKPSLDISDFEKIKDMDVEYQRLSNKSDDVEKSYYVRARDRYKSLVNAAQEVFPTPFAVMEKEHERDASSVMKLVELVKRFKVYYNREKKEINKLDFSDLEHYAVKILSNESIANSVRGKYDYICVDEYQDTNEVQEKIVEAISSGSNLFMVGDPKQSIYKFRFTEPRIFVGKLLRYEKEERNFAVKLNENYRSSPSVIARINSVFDVLMRTELAGLNVKSYSSLVGGLKFQDDGDSDDFQAGLYYRKSKREKPLSGVGVYRLSDDNGIEEEKSNARIEADYVAKKIKKLIGGRIYDAKLGDFRTVTFDDMAILASSRSESVKDILDILEKEYLFPIDSSPLRRKEETREVGILTSLLRVVDNSRTDLPLYTVMKVFFTFSDEELLAVRADNMDKKFFSEAVFDGEVKDAALKSKLEGFIEKFLRLRLMSQFMNVYDFLSAAIEETGYVTRLLETKGGKASLENINAFLASLKDKKHSENIASFLYACDSLELRGDTETKGESSNNAIHTSTIHQSKGLEYPIVFIIDAGRDFTPSEVYRDPYLLDKEYGIALKGFDVMNKTVYSNIMFKSLAMKAMKDEREERLRLLYVAMTRAKNRLYIVGSRTKEENGIEDFKRFTDALLYVANRDGDFRRYVEELNSPSQTDEKEADADDDICDFEGVRAFDYMPYTESEKKQFDDVFNYEYPYDEATRLSTKYTVTAINSEESDEEEYVEELYKEDSAYIGTAYHKLMENINYDADTEELLDKEFNRLLDAKIMTEEEIDLIDRRDILSCLNSDVINTAKRSRHEREKKFMMYLPLSEVKENAPDEKVIVQGILDLIIYSDNGNILVDFKKSSRKKSDLIAAYRKQLELYRFAIEKSMNIKVDKTLLYVLGRNETIEIE